MLQQFPLKNVCFNALYNVVLVYDRISLSEYCKICYRKLIGISWFIANVDIKIGQQCTNSHTTLKISIASKIVSLFSDTENPNLSLIQLGKS